MEASGRADKGGGGMGPVKITWARRSEKGAQNPIAFRMFLSPSVVPLAVHYTN
jgi:hypothetical protein